eukprot:2559688-Rhodomonas_salina.1
MLLSAYPRPTRCPVLSERMGQWELLAFRDGLGVECLRWQVRTPYQYATRMLLSAYERPMRCPVLPMSLLPMSLRAPYDISGTELAYHSGSSVYDGRSYPPTRMLRDVRYSPSVCTPPASTLCDVRD